MAMNKRKGFRFSVYAAADQTPFEKLFDIFKELITHTSGDVDEALDWLRELDKEYELTDENYTIEDFIEDLKAKGESNKTSGFGPDFWQTKAQWLWEP
jgi:Ca-activated chloride channel family protein